MKMLSVLVKSLDANDTGGKEATVSLIFVGGKLISLPSDIFHVPLGSWLWSPFRVPADVMIKVQLVSYMSPE